MTAKTKQVVLIGVAFVGGVVASIFLPSLQIAVAKMLGKEPVEGGQA